MIELTVDFHGDVNLEAIYLLGSFTVSLTGDVPVLKTLPDRLAPGDITVQGLPFYSGVITYLIPAPQISPSSSDDRYLLTLPALSAACAKIRSGVTDERLMLWLSY